MGGICQGANAVVAANQGGMPSRGYAVPLAVPLAVPPAARPRVVLPSPPRASVLNAAYLQASQAAKKALTPTRVPLQAFRAALELCTHHVDPFKALWALHVAVGLDQPSFDWQRDVTCGGSDLLVTSFFLDGKAAIAMETARNKPTHINPGGTLQKGAEQAVLNQMKRFPRGVANFSAQGSGGGHVFTIVWEDGTFDLYQGWVDSTSPGKEGYGIITMPKPGTKIVRAHHNRVGMSEAQLVALFQEITTGRNEVANFGQLHGYREFKYVMARYEDERPCVNLVFLMEVCKLLGIGVGLELLMNEAGARAAEADENFQRNLRLPGRAERPYFIRVEGDGNCLFRALSVALYGHPEKHASLREMAVRELRQHIHEFRAYGVTDPYLVHMARPGTWGGGIEILAIARLFQRRIHVYSSVFTNGATHTTFGQEAAGGPDLYLYFKGYGHYEAISARGAEWDAATRQQRRQGAYQV